MSHSARQVLFVAQVAECLFAHGDFHNSECQFERKNVAWGLGAILGCHLLLRV